MNARQKLDAKIRSASTKTLRDMATMLATTTDEAGIIVAIAIDAELEHRLDQPAFTQHLAEMEALLDAAA